MEPYYEAKREADEALRASGLAHTIVRPGALTDEPGTGLIEAGHAARARRRGDPRRRRRDPAAVLAEPHTAGLTFDLLNGDTPIAEAVASLVR